MADHTDSLTAARLTPYSSKLCIVAVTPCNNICTKQHTRSVKQRLDNAQLGARSQTGCTSIHRTLPTHMSAKGSVLAAARHHQSAPCAAHPPTPTRTGLPRLSRSAV